MRKTEKVRWEAPEAGWVKANCDGACKVGKATVAVVVRDQSRNLVDGAGFLINAKEPEIAEALAVQAW
ncbi:hypothetical protein DITRI_Ditri13aG0032400 [Diplodiscus trichospermus]